MNLKLTAPSMLVFFVSAALAIVVLLIRFGVSIPTFGLNSFTLLAIAYVVLLVGVLFRGA